MNFESWEEVKLGDIVTLKQGFAVNSKSNHYVVEKGIPLLKISDLFNGTETMFVKENIPKQFLVYEDEIIYSRTGQVGYAFMGRKGVVYNNCFKVIPNEKVDSIFLYQLLNTNEVRGVAQSLATGTAQPDLNHGAFKSIKIKLPSLPIQRKIAKILSNYDDLIENNLKLIKLLEEKARLTYEEWFLRFRIDGKKLEIDENTGLPFGWVKKKVGDLLGKVKSTVKIKTSDILSTGKHPVIDQSKDFVAGYTNEADINQYNDIPYIVFGDHTRVLKFVNFSFAKGADGTQVLISNSPRMPQVMFYHALINVDLSNYHYARHYKFLKAEEIIIPTLELAQRYEIFGNTIFDQIKNLRNQNNLLKESRDILLPRLMTGIIDVDKLDIEV